MLKTRVIPTLLMKDIGLVKGERFDSWRRVGTTLPAIRVYNRRCVDELIVLDISATSQGRAPDVEEVKLFAPDCFVPLTVGGGISSIEDIKNLLRSGADKVAINTAIYDDKNLIKDAAASFGAQCIVASIDVKQHQDGRYECFSNSGTIPRGVDPVTWAQSVQAQGAGEILLTSIDRDGTMQGYDVELIKLVSSVVSIPVIASGGAAGYKDFCNAIISGQAQAVAAASIFHFTEQTPLEAKTYMASQGINVRK